MSFKDRMLIEEAATAGELGRQLGRRLAWTGLKTPPASREKAIQRAQNFNKIRQQKAATNQSIQNYADTATNDARKRKAHMRVTADSNARRAETKFRQPLIDYANAERKKISQQNWANRKQATSDFTKNHLIPGAKMGASGVADTIGFLGTQAGRGLYGAGKAYVKHMPTRKYN